MTQEKMPSVEPHKDIKIWRKVTSEISDLPDSMGGSLLIGCDIRNMTAETMEIISNEEVSVVNQDRAIKKFQLKPSFGNQRPQISECSKSVGARKQHEIICDDVPTTDTAPMNNDDLDGPTPLPLVNRSKITKLGDQTPPVGPPEGNELDG
ncbi:uncharacterized protein LOC122091841 isoform X2 [Macadamia integrifolia]|uniref:uncharacterized protein LOC122091841 isoform X2 n=1 Tax=Macadamia integrifolia TaxID=60698 RepID=UPI001C4E93C3|nr:uncharacterized protein LOC122091841 isoform X2 [Macadamia integrifolia]